jgi:hypothetical protein
MTPGVLIKVKRMVEGLSQRIMWPESRASSVLSLSLRHVPLSIKCWSRWIKTAGIFTSNVPVVYMVRYVIALRGAYP